jgi:hypothetical protein
VQNLTTRTTQISSFEVASIMLHIRKIHEHVWAVEGTGNKIKEWILESRSSLMWSSVVVVYTLMLLYWR